MTGKVLMFAIKQYMKMDDKRGREVSLNHLNKSAERSNSKLDSIEVNNKNIQCFEKYAKRHSVKFALKKDGGTDPPTYTVIFKAKDNESIENALKDFTVDMIKQKKPSVIKKVIENKEIIKDNDKNKDIDKNKVLQKTKSKGDNAL